MKGNFDKDIGSFFDKMRGEELNELTMLADSSGLKGIQVDKKEARIIRFSLLKTSEWLVDYQCDEEETLAIKDLSMWRSFIQSFDRLFNIFFLKYIF